MKALEVPGSLQSVHDRSKGRSAVASVLCAGAILIASLLLSDANDSVAPRGGYDVALILAVDVSSSLNSERYRMQMEGIARALETIAAAGPNSRMVISMVIWSDADSVAVPWQPIASTADALHVARMVRALPVVRGEFTCLAKMLRHLREDLAIEAARMAAHVVIDVSGDGPDNCSGAKLTEKERDKLSARDVTINGLPIRNENDYVGTGAYRAPGFGWDELRNEPHMEGVTIEDWYRAHVIGGPGAFLILANGYEDFDRAFREKFLLEISELHQAR